MVRNYKFVVIVVVVVVDVLVWRRTLNIVRRVVGLG